MIETIGMIGVGAMGSALLERLKLAGVQAIVYDIDSSVLEAARSNGARIAKSAGEVAQASTIIDVVVRTDEEVLDCTTGKGGILESAKPETLVILHSTILPQTTRKVAEVVGKRNLRVIDACMLGVPRAVRAGDLIFVVGGARESVERARPHLLKMGKKVIHMGAAGAGNTSKLIKNLTSGAETLMIHEALRLGEAEGLKFPQVLEMLQQVESEKLLARWQRVFDPSLPAPTPHIGRNVFDKDIPLAGELARQSGLDLPIIEQLAAAAKRLVKQNKEKS
jgi:3-hydroxyisobutyrate dehydrogenase-like beta-hydroxyacid dehydrogenase